MLVVVLAKKKINSQRAPIAGTIPVSIVYVMSWLMADSVCLNAFLRRRSSWRSSMSTVDLTTKEQADLPGKPWRWWYWNHRTHFRQAKPNSFSIDKMKAMRHAPLLLYYSDQANGNRPVYQARLAWRISQNIAKLKLTLIPQYAAAAHWVSEIWPKNLRYKWDWTKGRTKTRIVGT